MVPNSSKPSTELIVEPMTSSYLIGTEDLWGQRLGGEVINNDYLTYKGVYALSRSQEIRLRIEDEELKAEISQWDEASDLDLADFESGLEDRID